MSYVGLNRRQYERRPISMQVKYRNLDSFFSEYSISLSHGGIFIETETEDTDVKKAHLTASPVDNLDLRAKRKQPGK